MEKSINEKEQCVQTDVMQSVIKGKHLRIGNLVFFNGNHNEIGVVSEIIKNDLTKVSPYKIGINHRIDIYYEIDKLKPIPLTEEWLAKLGYDLISENHYGILGHLIWKIEGRFYCDKNGMQLKYVHQLQNLYFALTGSELTVA